jgi:hypothetical protein
VLKFLREADATSLLIEQDNVVICDGRLTPIRSQNVLSNFEPNC